MRPRAVLAPDPPLPRDGRCIVCGGERNLKQKPLYRRHAEVDPFCSTACCRRWHGVKE